MRKSTAQKDLAGHRRQLRGPNVARGPWVGQPCSRPRTQKKSEAKAKNSSFEDRPSQGQGQDCSRPRPRTKDTAASVLLINKKGLQKFFSGNLQFIGIARIFEWGGSNYKSHAMTSSNIFKRGTFCWTKIS